MPSDYQRSLSLIIATSLSLLWRRASLLFSRSASSLVIATATGGLASAVIAASVSRVRTRVSPATATISSVVSPAVAGARPGSGSRISSSVAALVSIVSPTSGSGSGAAPKCILDGKDTYLLLQSLAKWPVF